MALALGIGAFRCFGEQARPGGGLSWRQWSRGVEPAGRGWTGYPDCAGAVFLLLGHDFTAQAGHGPARTDILGDS